MTITIEHFKQAVEAAKAGHCIINGNDYTYNQSRWECRTTCCVWGFVAHSAGIPVGKGPTDEAKAIAPLACSLMQVPNPRVLPVIDAAVNGGDVEAAARDARKKGLNIWAGGTSEKMTGGEALLYGNSTLTEMTDGKSWLYDNSTLTTMTGGTAWLDDNSTLTTLTGGEALLYGKSTLTTMVGGRAWLCGKSTLTTMTGGTAWLYGPDAKVVNHLGGTVIRLDLMDCVWVEVSRVTKEVTP